MTPLEYIFSNAAREEICHFLFENNIETHLKSIENFKIPKLLYKYSNISRYLLDNLRENDLTATSPAKFNDVYDSTMHFNTVEFDKKRINELNESSIKHGFGEVIKKKHEAVLLERSKDIDEYSLTLVSKSFRIVCLSSEYDDIKMWSHYADMNNGICIAYDFTKSTNNLYKYIYPINYINKPIDVTKLCEIKNETMLAALISVISKFEDWEHEKEWRLIFYLPDDQNQRLPIYHVPKPEFILLGNRFIDNIDKSKIEKPEYYIILKEFIKYVEESQIELKIIKPQIRSYQLEYEDIYITEITKMLR